MVYVENGYLLFILKVIDDEIVVNIVLYYKLLFQCSYDYYDVRLPIIENCIIMRLCVCVFVCRYYNSNNITAILVNIYTSYSSLSFILGEAKRLVSRQLCA